MFIFLLLSVNMKAQQVSSQNPLDTKISSGFIDPNNYLVGPGDSLLILIKGLDELAWKINVSQEGTIYVPKVGEIAIKNLNLAVSKIKIGNAIKQFYKNVDIFITLIDVRKIKVSLNGDVKKSSVVIVPATSRLSDVIGGNDVLNPTADLRNIKIMHDDNSFEVYDFVAYTRKDDKSQNPRLKDGDFIYLDKTDKTIAIFGSVKFPAQYNFKSDETVADVIDLSGGVLTEAKTDSIELVRFADDYKTQKSFFLSLAQAKSFKLQNKDKIIVRSIPEYLRDEIVSVQGFVRYPGVYKIKDGETKLSEVINDAGGFLQKASLKDAALYRITLSDTTDIEYERLKNLLRKDMTDDEYDYLKAKSRQPKGKVVVNFEDVFLSGNKSEDVVLRKNDFILVPEKKDYVNLIGQVVHPGKIPYDQKLTVKDYINLAGGFGWRAVESDVRLVRANSGEWVDEDDVKEIFPGDIIWIPENPPPPKFWDFTKDALFIIGQVATVVTAAVAIIATRK